MTSPVKVLMVTGSYPPMRCGVGDYTAHLAEALSGDPGFKVTVLTTELDAPPQSAPGPEVSRIMSTWLAKGLDRFFAAMQRLDPDIVHIQFPTQGYDFLNGLAVISFRSRFRLRVPVVATLHEFLPRTFSKADCCIYAMALCANRIVAVRPEYHDKIPWPMKAFIRKSKIRFIPNTSTIPGIALSAEERQAVRKRLGCETAGLVAFFGFSFPHKGVDLLFQIADPRKHHLLLIGELLPGDAYHAHLRRLADSGEWRGRVTITGFVEATEAGRLLAAADAAVFPYRVGGGIWNSSLHAAARQGTFVLMTSLERNGYDRDANIYYARPDAVVEMRQALLEYLGTRKDGEAAAGNAWLEITRAHKELYLSLLRGSARHS